MEHSLGRTGPCLFLQFLPPAQPVPITHSLWRGGVPTRIQTHIHEHLPVFTLRVFAETSALMQRRDVFIPWFLLPTRRLSTWRQSSEIIARMETVVQVSFLHIL